MNLTVTARIAGGAGVVILLLALLVFNGLSGVNSINDGLVSVTEKSTPMLVEEGEIVQTLLHAAAEVNFYHQSYNSEALDKIESKYQGLVNENKHALQNMLALADGFPDIYSNLKAGEKSIQSYFEVVPKSFDAHQVDVQLKQEISEKRSDFEDVADELDSLLFDFADEVSNAKLSATLKDLSAMVREATITVTDTLSSSEVSHVQVAANDISSLITEFEKKFKSVSNSSSARANEYYADTAAAIAKFEHLVIGDDNILDALQKQLESKLLAKQLLVQSGKVAAEALGHLRSVTEEVKILTNKIKQEANENVSSSRALIIGFAIVAIIVAIGINLWVLQSIRTPLAEVLRVMSKVSSGDLRETVKVTSSDEIGKLSEGFNQLINQLSSMLNEISGSSQQLSAAAEETSAISSQSHENINQQKVQTDMMATAMTEMTATVDEVANSAKSTSTEVGKADKEAIEGQTIVQNNIATINGLADEIQNAAQVIDKLDQYSTNIGAVLDVIRGIADQTNLLALNAAIEAARAGEQGRGFAVVADEVRTLASKTQESTSEIQEMIERLQSGTQEAVKVMKTSTREAQNSVNETAKAGESLTKNHTGG
ncbi:MAG: methyl-accepting chemotaxis protein [Enterobacterales bacterium]|nr:methyl-accepting chemotaxis protein [Enterobacterales bacterium]